MRSFFYLWLYYRCALYNVYAFENGFRHLICGIKEQFRRIPIQYNVKWKEARENEYQYFVSKSLGCKGYAFRSDGAWQDKECMELKIVFRTGFRCGFAQISKCIAFVRFFLLLLLLPSPNITNDRMLVRLNVNIWHTVRLWKNTMFLYPNKRSQCNWNKWMKIVESHFWTEDATTISHQTIQAMASFLFSPTLHLTISYSVQWKHHFLNTNFTLDLFAWFWFRFHNAFEEKLGAYAAASHLEAKYGCTSGSIVHADDKR